MGATPPGASGDDTDAGSTSDGFPRSDDGALFGKMMRAIRGGHTLGNRIRMLKLPLILTDSQLYGGAIANFYWLTRALERALDDPIAQSHPVLAPVRALGLRLTAGYEKDLAQIFGPRWEAVAAGARTAATDAYVAEIEQAEPARLVAAAFILYGALVIGGGRQTQAKVRKVFSGCDHALYDVADDMSQARKAFRECFNSIGERFPEHREVIIRCKCKHTRTLCHMLALRVILLPHHHARLCREAAEFMQRNNSVVLSVRCLPTWWWRAVGVAALAIAAARAWSALRS